MIYLILAILTSTSIIIAFKIFARFNVHNIQAITINYLIASVFGFLIYSGDISIKTLPDKGWFPFALLVGLLFILCFYIFALSAQKVGVAITAVSSKMSVVIPVVAGLFLYDDEKINLIKTVGIIITLLAFYFILQKGKNAKFKKIVIILPLFIFLGSGINDSLLNYCENFFISDSNELILFISVIFSVALLLGSGFILIRFIFMNEKIKMGTLFAGIILGMLNFGSTYYFLKGLGIYSGSFFFPIFNVGIVSLAAIVGYIGFKEKFRAANWFGIILAIIAIVLIAFAESIQNYDI